jgi:hypothetical protein
MSMSRTAPLLAALISATGTDGSDELATTGSWLRLVVVAVVLAVLGVISFVIAGKRWPT